MRFRLVDRILATEPDAIETLKTISFEEFSLLKPWGRKGAFPESLMLQMAVESASMLMAHRSRRQCLGVLDELQEVRFHAVTRPGEVLRCRVEGIGETFAFQIHGHAELLVSGSLAMRAHPLKEAFEPEAFDLQWKAIHASA
jgi:3-hydroxymyristoyl/3-hydroxydecanoyl-(acyl carrier protein) dehydratase